MKRWSLVVTLSATLVLTAAAPAQAAPSTPRVNLGPLVSSVLGLLLPPESEPVQSPPELASIERELEKLLSVESTAYCLTGTMASGKAVYEGAAAMNGVPLGAQYQVVDGPQAGTIYTIEDRISHSSDFDIAFPGDCEAAIQYGRRTINIEPVASG